MAPTVPWNWVLSVMTLGVDAKNVVMSQLAVLVSRWIERTVV